VRRVSCRACAGTMRQVSVRPPRPGWEDESSTEGDDVGHLEGVALDAIEDVDLLEHELDGVLFELLVVVVHNFVHHIIVLLHAPHDTHDTHTTHTTQHDTTRPKTHRLHACATKRAGREGGLGGVYLAELAEGEMRHESELPSAPAGAPGQQIRACGGAVNNVSHTLTSDYQRRHSHTTRTLNTHPTRTTGHNTTRQDVCEGRRMTYIEGRS
jgi:hypothetical protein